MVKAKKLAVQMIEFRRIVQPPLSVQTLRTLRRTGAKELHGALPGAALSRLHRIKTHQPESGDECLDQNCTAADRSF